MIENLHQEENLFKDKNTNISKIAKHTLVTTLLSVSIFLTVNEIVWFISQQNFFLIDSTFSIKIICLMMLNLYFMALSIATWGKWVNSLITSATVALSIFVGIFTYNTTYSLYLLIIVFLLLTLDSFRSFELKSIFIKYNPRLILKFSTKGLTFVLSILAGTLVFFGVNNIENINIGKKIADFAAKPVQNVVDKEVDKQITNIETTAVNNFSISPSIVNMLSNFDVSDPDLTEDSLQENAPVELINRESLQIDVAPIIEKQVNNAVEPYEKFVSPLLAILLFGIFQFYGGISYLLYSLTIGTIFRLLTKIGFIKTELVTVEQERLTF